jgi:hypothetical protein
MGSETKVKLSALSTGRTLLPRKLICLLLVLIFVRGCEASQFVFFSKCNQNNDVKEDEMDSECNLHMREEGRKTRRKRSARKI